MSKLCVSLVVFVLMSGASSAGVTVSVVDIPTRGVMVRILVVKPDAPVASVILARGGDGIVGIQHGSPPASFQLLYADRGIATAIVDVPSDQYTGISRAFRRTGDHAADIVEVIRYLRSQANVPIWFLGISNGTISVANAVLRLPADLSLGAVLASPVTSGPDTLFEMDLASLRSPTLVLSHSADRCQSTPPYNAALLVDKLTLAPAADHVALTGGNDSGDPCDGFHLFSGLDMEVIATVAGFIGKHSHFLVPPIAETNYQGLW